MSEEHQAPKVVLDVVDAVALPTVSVADLERASANWRVVVDPPIELACALKRTDLTAADIVIVELVTERAGLADVRDAFVNAGLVPGGLADAFRLFAATEPSQWQAFPFVCLGASSTARNVRSPMINCAGAATVVVSEVSLYDDDARPELGWTDHCLVIARPARTDSGSQADHRHRQLRPEKLQLRYFFTSPFFPAQG